MGSREYGSTEAFRTEFDRVQRKLADQAQVLYRKHDAGGLQRSEVLDWLRRYEAEYCGMANAAGKILPGQSYFSDLPISRIYIRLARVALENDLGGPFVSPQIRSQK